MTTYCKAKPPGPGVLPSAGGPDDCAVSKIDQFRKVLADTSAPAAERELAILHLMHLVGDIHQPLHAAERNHDGGGNSQLIFFSGQKWGDTLHGFWDGQVGRCDVTAAGGDNKCVKLTGAYSVIGDKLIQRIDKAETSGWFAGENATAAAWARAASRVARSDAGYGGLGAEVDCLMSVKPTRRDPNPKPKDEKCAEVSQGYYLTAAKASDQQLMLAGYRLAAVIIEGLKKG